MYAQLEQRVLESSIEGVALRYGFFYGPNTWYNPNGGAADEVRKQQFPVIEGGEAKWSFVHIEDAAQATVAALMADPGKYVVVDDDPSPVSVWLVQVCELYRRSASAVHDCGTGAAGCGRGCGLLPDEVERSFECEGKTRV
jgi:nucleoside-diphosphate-sugar epimerase